MMSEKSESGNEVPVIVSETSSLNAGVAVATDEPFVDDESAEQETHLGDLSAAKGFVESDEFKKLDSVAQGHFLVLLRWVEKKQKYKRESKGRRKSKSRTSKSGEARLLQKLEEKKSKEEEEKRAAERKSREKIEARTRELLKAEMEKLDNQVLSIVEEVNTRKRNGIQRKKHIVKFGEGLEVCGVIGSSADGANAASTYKDAFKLKPECLDRYVGAQDEAKKCGVLGCQNDSSGTAHLYVRLLGKPDDILLYPLCGDPHNKSGGPFDLSAFDGETEWMKLKTGHGVLWNYNVEYFSENSAKKWFAKYSTRIAAANPAPASMLPEVSVALATEAKRAIAKGARKKVNNPGQASNGAPPPPSSKSKSKK